MSAYTQPEQSIEMTERQMSAAGKRIIVVDDEALIRWSLKEALTADGFEVSAASDGQEALVLAMKKEVDLVVTDLRMANMDGMQFIECLQTIRSGAKIIVLTAYGSEENRSRAAQLGVDAFFSKPFDMAELRMAVREALFA